MRLEGASISARDDKYRSTPHGWGARAGVLNMVELLRERGAVTHLPEFWTMLRTGMSALRHFSARPKPSFFHARPRVASNLA